MKTDDRDEALASILDEAIQDISVGTREAPVSAVGGIGRPVRAIAAAAAAAVFVAGMVFAASQFGGDVQGSGPRPGPLDPEVRAGWITRSAGPGGFSVDVSYPKRWKLASYGSLVIDSNTQPILRLRTSAAVPQGPVCGELQGLAVLQRGQAISIGTQSLGPNQAVISVQAYHGGGWKEPPHLPRFVPRPASIAWADAQRGAHFRCLVGGTESATFFVLERGRWIFHVVMGSEVRNGGMDDRILEVLDGLRLPEDSSAPIRFLPSHGWDTGSEAGDRRYTPVSAWTANAELPTQDGATFPGIEALPEDGVLVTAMQIGNESPAPDNPNFALAGLPLDIPEQVESSWEGYIDGRGRSRLDVVVNGRALNIRIYYGTATPNDDVRAEAEAALERLLVDPLPTA